MKDDNSTLSNTVVEFNNHVNNNGLDILEATKEFARMKYLASFVVFYLY